ncbi:tRNA lysidine(34) synthetase TilS [Sphingomonas sp. S1-29]|uniref:tRNA lysidine(34) synthetase TilS n=1 Tax=Sphingomonas sp. S1-29 TaxID=2991074 RepID=UPI00223FF837|nr:tRNA lysidine(34) synthetase TilS [Sphingomonas sp. S1-29]UZK68434.1 tRNA lysidine(34) synthetase TilS [Sphingomonas sp. S1-29]
MVIASPRAWPPTSQEHVPLPSAADTLIPDAGAVARFRGDLARLVDIERVQLLVAVSGGPDSLALLLLASAALGDRCSAATVDHGIRSAAADEAAFVARLCADRGLRHSVLTGDLPPRVGRTANLSTRARALRYALLETHMADIGADRLATGHHADDQIETVVMRLNRGAGVAGLAGIRAGGGRVVRPLLGWRRSDLAAMVAACGISAIDDPSNIDDRYDRARLRKALRDNPLLDAAGVVASASALADADAALGWTARQLFDSDCRRAANGIVFDVGDIPFELRRRIVERCLRAIDPAIAMRGEALVRFVRALDSGRPAVLGGVKGAVVTRPDNGTAWHFAPAPPRRAV